jgi:hypothetical protein
VILTLSLAMFPAQAEEVGRVYAHAGALLRSQPERSAPTVRALLEGDELVPVNLEDSELALKRSELPAGWQAYSTIEVDSQRLFVGYLPTSEVSVRGPSDARRQQILERAASQMLHELSIRAARFASLREKRDLPALAEYMDSAVTPLLLDAQDVIGQLRDVSAPNADALQKQLTKLTGLFKP